MSFIAKEIGINLKKRETNYKVDPLLPSIFPQFSRPIKSRFDTFFKYLPKQNKTEKFDDETSSNKKIWNFQPLGGKSLGNMDVIPNNILSFRDKRTSLMLKNLPTNITEENLINLILSVTKINYAYIPKMQNDDKLLGFAFINVVNFYEIPFFINKINDIIFSEKNFLGDNIKSHDSWNNSNSFFIGPNQSMSKKIEICYSKKQGLKSLMRTFGKNHVITLDKDGKLEKIEDKKTKNINKYK